MAVQAQMYPDNLGMMPFCGSLDLGGGVGGLSNNDFCLNLQYPQESQQLQHPQQMQQRQQQFLLPQPLQNPQHKNQFLALDNNFVFSAVKTQPSTINHNQNNKISMAFSQSMVEKQRQEIDGFINLQNERLKIVLQEQRKQQLESIIRKLEARTAIVLKQKDEEIAQATKRTMDLQEFMKRLEMENEAWKGVAGENEAMIANLNTTLEQLREKAAISLRQQQASNGDVEDAESCCDLKSEEEEDDDDEQEEERTGENTRTRTGEVIETGERNSKRRKTMMMMMMVCRNCNSRNSSVLFLPCRHLCCCTACEAFLYACPVCKSAKKGSIEALLS